MPPDVQAKLLRVVENREYYPLGARRPVRANLRVIAATNAPERIRKDLVHRLGNPVCLPRLDQRREDIPALIGHFLRGQKARSLEVAAFQAVMGYAWPGNVRELRKTMERAAAMAEEDGVETIGVEHLPGQVTRETREGSAHEAPEERPSPLSDHPVPPRQRRPSSVELRTLLEEHRGNVPQVARVLGRRREQVWRWCKADGVDPRGFRR
jgi:DNA-binding NtrC family response regulator